MQNNAETPFDDIAEQLDRLAKEYVEKLRHVHPQLNDTELQDMAENSAFMQMRMEGKV